MLSFIGSFGLFLIIGIPLLALIIIPIYLYYEVLRLARRYTLTRFLIAWPMAIIQSIVKGIGIVVLSLLSFLIFVVVLNLILVYVFSLSDVALEIISITELVIYFTFILGFIITDAATYFKVKVD